MLFNSAEYLVFFFAALAVCWLTIGMPRLRIWLLLIASYYFYVANNHWLIVLLLVSTQIDYVAGRRIEATRSARERKLWLVLSIATNLSILGTFKYLNFFASTAQEVVTTLGFTLSWVDVNIVLPVGISFYTFQSMSYTIDVYRGTIPAERSWHRFAFYVAYFPQLVAGPIMRASYFMPQLQHKPRLDAPALERALLLIFRGLVKKIILADFLGIWADAAFGDPTGVDSLAAWVGVYAFSFQIYFDFSGYTDIAIGCSRLLGLQLPDNFVRPYMAAGFSDFWRRWHISLSSWLRDYLYVPLGGNRSGGRWRTNRNLMLTMFLGGLWHGAAWHFVLWGVVHGVYLIGERFVGRRVRPSACLPLSWALVGRRLAVFHLITATWLLFRCDDLVSLMELVQTMFRFHVSGPITYGLIASALVCLGGWLAQLIGEHSNVEERFLAQPVVVKGLAYACVWVVVVVFNSQGSQPFIYFQF